ncbi:MAG: hypothetical protein ACXVI9_08210 [Mucilaginibacter sp.]
MKPFLPLLCLGFLLPLKLFAQSFYPGYVVTNNGDTLKGYVKYHETVLSPKVAEFKTEPNGTERIYQAAELKYFSIRVADPLDVQLEFQRYSGPVSMNDININTVTTERDTSFKTSDVFLKILRKDKRLSLYSYDDQLKTRFFIADGQSAPVELIYRIYLKNDISNGNNTKNEDTYKKQFIALATKYGKLDDGLMRQLDKIDYSEKYMIQIVDKINGFTGPDPMMGSPAASPPKAKLLIMLAAFAGVAILMLSVMHK